MNEDPQQHQQSPEVAEYRRRQALRQQRPTEAVLFGPKTEGAFLPLGKPARLVSRELPQLADTFARKRTALEAWLQANLAEPPEVLLSWLGQAVGIKIDTKPAEGEEAVFVEQPVGTIVLHLGPFSGTLEYYQLEDGLRDEWISRLRAMQH